jgi:hypothetical protein
MCPLIWVGVAAIRWAIWKCRNDIIFKKVKFNSLLQVIFRGAHWLRFWAQLQHKEQAKDTLIAMSRNLEVVALFRLLIEDGTIFTVYLSRSLLPVSAFFTLLWTVPLNSVIMGCVHLRM